MITLTALLAIFAYGLMSALLGALLPTYRLVSAEQGSLALLNALGLIVASVSVGWLVDRKGAKPALIVGLLLMTFALLTAPQASAYRTLLVTYFTLGVGGGIVTTSGNALVAVVSPDRRRAALNFANLFFGLGGVVTTSLAAYLLAPASLCYAIAAVAVLTIIAAILTSVPKSSTDLAPSRTKVARLLSNPVLIALSFFMFLYVACEVGIWNWLRVYLISIRFDAKTAGGTVSYGFALGMLVGRLIVSRLPKRISTTALLVTASFFIAFTTASLLSFSSRSAVTLSVFAAGLAMAPVFPTTLSVVADQFPHESASAIGLVVTAGWLGLAISSPVIGAVAQEYSLLQALWLLPALATCMILISRVLVKLVPQPSSLITGGT